MINPQEKLSDAMAMVSVHARPVFLAMVDPESDHLQMLYVTTPQSALAVVDAASARKTSGDFFKEVMEQGSQEFRVAKWEFTAVALAVPSCEEMQKTPRAIGRYRLPSRWQDVSRTSMQRSRVLECV